jgi:RNA polymerase sigma-70 factor (ECF subfamily)
VDFRLHYHQPSQWMTAVAARVSWRVGEPMGAVEREVGMASDDGFDEFYQGAFGRLVGQVYLVTGDLGDAEDAVQEAFARASVRWGQVREFAVPEQWVRRVAMNLALDGLRRARRRLAALARLGPGPVAPPISVERVALAEALRTLPRSYRQVIVLHHLLELPVEQVARELGIPTGTVKGRLSRGRRALAARLDPAAEEVATTDG